MRKTEVRLVILACAICGLLSGCERRTEVASPSCVALGTNINEAERKELEKKCPRTGPAFKPSTKKEW
jgi:entry exclusion lipoprotein TrbK